MKKLLIIALLLLPTIVSAQLTVPQGGTGKISFPIGGLIYSESNQRLGATFSPTVGSLTATSTTATSTFANGINITGGCFAVNGTCFVGGGSSASSTLYTDNGSWSGNNIFNNLSLLNNTALLGYDTGGTPRNLSILDTDDIVRFGDVSLPTSITGDYVMIEPLTTNGFVTTTFSDGTLDVVNLFSDNNTWSGTNSWSGLSTFSATTTFSDDVIVDDSVAGTSTMSVGQLSNPGCQEMRDTSDGAFSHFWMENGIIYVDTGTCQ